MLRKTLRFSAVLVLVLLLSATAYADVVGTWDIDGIISQKISIKGLGSDGGRGRVADEFVFNQDGSFTMIDLPAGAGTWGYVKKKFAVYLDSGALETLFTDSIEDMFWYQGIDAEVQTFTITKNAFTGKENKDGTIKGKWGLAFETYLYSYPLSRGFNVKYKSTITFTGIRVASADILAFESDQSQELPRDSIRDIIAETVVRKIQEAFASSNPLQ